jgi:hypothetical protein
VNVRASTSTDTRLDHSFYSRATTTLIYSTIDLKASPINTRQHGPHCPQDLQYPAAPSRQQFRGPNAYHRECVLLHPIIDSPKYQNSHRTDNIAFLVKHIKHDDQPHHVSLSFTKTLDLDALVMKVHEKIYVCIHQGDEQVLAVVGVCVINDENNALEALAAAVDRCVDRVIESAIRGNGV